MLRKRNALIVFLSLVFLLTALHGIAFAHTEFDPAETEAIAVDEEKPVDIVEEDQAATFKFTPTESGEYVFESFENEGDWLDTFGTVTGYDEETESFFDIATDYASGSHNMFRIIFEAEAGKQYYLQAKMFYGGTGQFKISIRKYDIAEIRYTPSKKLQFIENDTTHGYYNNVFFIYQFHPSKDDVFTLIDKDGKETNYVYDENNQFKDGDNVLSWDIDITCTHNQTAENPWRVNNTYQFTIDYFGKSCKVDVDIIESPITGIEFIPAKAYSFYENDTAHGSYSDEGFFYYDIPNVNSIGDVLIVKTEDDEKEYRYGNYGFVNVEDENDILEQGKVTKRTDQNLYHWTIDGEYNYITVSYLGKTYNVPVTIKDNNIVGISFTHEGGYEFIEGNSEHGYFDDNLGYFRYKFYPSNGDVLTIDTEDGNSIDYTYDNEYGEFINGEDRISWDLDMNISDDQDTNQWVVNNTYQFTIGYLGQTCNVDVTIIKDPVAGIEYTPSAPYEYIEHDLRHGEYVNKGEDDEWFRYDDLYYQQDDKLTILMSDGTSKVYTCQYSQDIYDWVFVGEDDTINCHDVNIDGNQDSKHWEIDEDNKVTVTYLDKECTVDVTITENPVKGIEYQPANECKFVVDTQGQLSEYNGEEYYEYDYNRVVFQLGDKLIAHTNNGDKVYVYKQVNLEDFSEAFECDGEYLTRWNDVDCEARQWEKHWSLGSDNYIVCSAFGYEYKIPVEIIENPIAEISYTPAEPYKYKEEDTSCGKYENEGTDDEWFRYYVSGCQNGDVLTVTTTEGETKEYTFQYLEQYGDDYFVSNSDDEKINRGDVSITSDQDDNHWTLEGENKVTVEYLNRTCSVDVKIEGNPVRSIEYVPAGDCQIVENTHGNFEFNNEGQFYRYDSQYVLYKKGDRIIVHTLDGDKVYEYKHVDNYGDAFECDGEIIETSEISLQDYQWSDPWVVGSSNSLYISVFGRSYRVQVEIIENPVESIAYIPAEPYRYLEDDTSTGYYENEGTEDEWFRYHNPSYQEGDILTITTTTGEVKNFKYQDVEGEGSFYVSDDNEKIDYYEVIIGSDQEENHWTLGDSNRVNVTYLNRECNVNVEIYENPVKSIRFEPADPYVFVKEDTAHGYWVDEGTDDEYFVYNIPWYAEGDKLVADMTDGTSKIYEYRYNEDGEGRFVYADEILKPYDDINRNEGDQYSEHWDVGEHSFSLTCFGRTYDVPVMIVDNPVDYIEFSHDGEYEYIEGTNGQESTYYEEEYFDYFLPEFKTGDMITVHMISGESVEYVYDDNIEAFVDGGGNVLEDVMQNSYQHINHWEVGKDNYFTVSYRGKSVDVKVNIVENPVKGIKYIPKKPYKYIENDTRYGYVDYDYNDEKFFHYNEPWYKAGDQLIVETTSEDKVYTYGYSENEGTYCFIGESDVIKQSEVQLGANQYNNHWTLGDDNYMTIHYMGNSYDIPVSIIVNPVLGIEYVPAKPYEYIEEDLRNGDYDEDEDGEFFWYNTPGIEEGDQLIVETEDGKITYVYNEEKDQFVNAEDAEDTISASEVGLQSNQSETHWTLGDNSMTASYSGKTCEVPVSIVKSPFKSIKFEPADPYKIVENDTAHGYVENEGKENEYFEYYIPWFKAGDKLIIETETDTKEYIYDEDIESFINGKELIRESELRKADDQSENHWTLGENTFTITYQGLTYEVPVEIIENTVTAISFKAAQERMIIENDPGYGYERAIYDDDDNYIGSYFHYDFSFIEGDELTVETTNDSKTYKFQRSDNGSMNFISDDNQIITEDDIEWLSDQASDHWDVGVHDYIIRYMGSESTVPVTIVENIVKSISFEPVDPYEYFENDITHGNYEYSEAGQYFWYHYQYHDGDILKITDAKGTKSYQFDSDSYEFVGENGTINTNSLRMYDSQDEEHWTVGGDNYFTLDYLGVTCKVPVSIVASPIESIEFIPFDPYKINEEDGDYNVWDEAYYYDMPAFVDGDKLIVKTESGEKTYIGQQRDEEFVFVNEKDETDVIVEGEFEKTSEQSEISWKPDKENYFTLTYKGKSCKVSVTIIAKSDDPEEAARARAVAEAQTLLNSDDIKNVKEADYTADTYKKFADAKKDLEDAIANKDSKAADITAATTDLTNAMSKLKTKAAQEAENRADAVKDANTLLNSDDIKNVKEADYTEDTYKEFAKAKKALEDAIANKDSKAADITAATTDLTKAKSHLKTKAAQEAEDRADAVKDANTLLNSDDIKNVKEADYTEDTYKEFAKAKKALEDAIANKDSKAADITAATTDLTKAKSHLKTKAAQEAEDRADAVKDANTELGKANAVDGAAYTDASYKAVTDAKATLEAALADSKSTSEDIKKATKALTDALAGLKTKEQEAAEQEAAAKAAAKTAADKAVADAAALNAADYTKESYKAVADAKAALEAVLAKADAKAADITAATKTLTDAIAALEKIPAVADGDVVTVSGSSYVVTSTAKLTVALKKAKNTKSMTIPATVKLADGKSYKVTQVNGVSLKGNKIRTVTVGKNVKKLAKNAFKSSRATKIILETKLLKKSGVKGSLKGSKVKKVYVKVGSKKLNKKTVKAYKKIFTKKIAGKKVKIK